MTDIDASLAFYQKLGFSVAYARPENGFVYLEREGAPFMIETITPDRWITGDLTRPLGRGINLQIKVSDVDALYRIADEAAFSMFKPLYDAWYRKNDVQVGNRQFLLQDPDGYLLRFFQDLGTRPVMAA